jgi:hypothetical protein
VISKDETSFELDLGEILGDLPRSRRKEALTDVGEFLVESVLDYLGQGKSPVSGVRSFKQLNKSYAEKEKEGDRLPNLDLHGDMLNALTFKVKGSKVIIGIFDEDQAIKSYNHNVGDTLPKRQFIPDESQTFKPDIMRNVEKILEEYLDE